MCNREKPYDKRSTKSDICIIIFYYDNRVMLQFGWVGYICIIYKMKALSWVCIIYAIRQAAAEIRLRLIYKRKLNILSFLMKINEL